MTRKKSIITGSIAAFVIILGTVTYGVLSSGVHRWLCTQGIAGLEKKLHTRIHVDSIDVHLFKGNIALYGFEMDDHSKVTMLKVDTMSVSADIFALLEKSLVLKEVKMAGATAVLYKERKDTAANYQFVIDAFKSKKKKKDEDKEKKNGITMDLDEADFSRLNVSWDVRSERVKGGDTLDVNHLQLQNIHLSLKGELRHKKTLDVVVSELMVREKKSGFTLSMREGEYRTIGGHNIALVVKNMKARYQDKRVGFDKLSVWQSRGKLQLDKEFSVRIDSLRYFCNNGKPRKNFNKPHRGAFDPGHLDAVMNIEAEMHYAKKDSIVGTINHMWAHDIGSGLIIKDFSTYFCYHHRMMDLTMAKINLPRTRIKINTVSAAFPKGQGLYIQPCRVLADVCLKDLAQPFAPALSNFETRVHLSVDADGTLDCLNMRNIQINSFDNRLRLIAQGNILDITKKKILSLHFRDIHLTARGGIKEEIVNHFKKKINIKMDKQMRAIGDVQFSGILDIPYKHEHIAGTLFTNFGNISFDFDIDNNTHYLTGTMYGNSIEIGKVMNVDKLGSISAKAQYSFNVASKRKMRALGLNPGKLPQGWLNATIEDVSFKGIHFHNLHTEMKSDGTFADGIVSTSMNTFNLSAEFMYKQTATEQWWKVKPRLTKRPLSFKELFKKKQKDKAKAQKKAAKKAQKDAVNAKKSERKSIMARIKENLSSLKGNKSSSTSSSKENESAE